MESTEILLDTDLTPTELARVESLETKLRMSEASALEQKIIQGETLFKIQQERLYRSRQPGERFSWEQYLKHFTPGLTPNGKGYGYEAAQLRCLLYLFHSDQFLSGATPDRNLPKPTGLEQLRPLLSKAPQRNPSQGGGFDLSGDWTAVCEIWAGANAKKRNPDRTSVQQAREMWETMRLREGKDPGRVQSEAQKAATQASLEKANAARAASKQAPEPTPTPKPTSAPAPSIPAWDIEKDESSIDAGAECKRISLAISEAHRAIGTLRGILFSQLNKYGSDYLDFLRQVDAGVYSLNTIDDQLEQMANDVNFTKDLLTRDFGQGELAESTIEVEAMPTRA